MRTETGRPRGEATGSGVGGPARCSSARDDRSQPGRWRLRGGGRVCPLARRGQGECRCDSVLAAGSSAVRPVWSREQLSTAFSGLVSCREAAARARLRGRELAAAGPGSHGADGRRSLSSRSRRGLGGTAGYRAAAGETFRAAAESGVVGGSDQRQSRPETGRTPPPRGLRLAGHRHSRR